MTDYIGPHESMPIIRARVHGEVSDRLQILADGTFLKGDGTGTLWAEGGYVELAATGDGVTDDTASIQATLAANPGKPIRGKRDKTYVISAPLVVKSNTTLDMTGCTVKLKTGTGGNMLVNEALTTARSVIDAGITSGQATLTSATAAFTSGDVGKAVTIVGAGPSGSRLVTTISAYTDASTVTLAANASTTVTNAWATIGTRDKNITVRGGVWDRQNNTQGGNGGYLAHTIRLRRADNVRVEQVRGEGTAGKYFVSLADVWEFSTETVFNNGFSDGVHINGPARHGVIRNTHAGKSGDDVVSLTASDFTTYPAANNNMADTVGDIEDVLIDGIDADYGSTRAFLCAAGTVSGRAMNVRRIKFRNVYGSYASFGGWVGGDNHDAALRGGTYRDIDIEGMSTNNVPGTSGTLMLYEGDMDAISLRNIAPGAGDGSAVQIGASDYGPTIGKLTVDGVRWANTKSSSGGTGAVTIFAGTIEHLHLGRAHVNTPNWSGVNLVYLPTGGVSAPNIKRLSAEGCSQDVAAAGSASATVYQQRSDATLSTVALTGIQTKNVTYVLGRYPATTRVKATNVHAEGAASGIRVDAAGVVTLEAQNIDTNADGFSLAAGGSLRLLGFGCRGDLATTGVQKNAGDMAFNTNAGNALGAVGPCIANGTNWKHLYSGTTL